MTPRAAVPDVTGSKQMEKNKYEEIKLTRDGKRPLAFRGVKIAEDTTRDHNSTRWTKVHVYETDKGKVVVGIGYLSCWDGESARYTAEAFSSKEEAVSHIEEHAEPLAGDIADQLDVAERI